MRNLSKILLSFVLMMVCAAASAQKINVSGTIFDLLEKQLSVPP